MSAKGQAEYCARLRGAARKLGQRQLGKGQSRFTELLMRVHDRLAQPPRLLLLGEFNSGKSLLANLLIGESVVPTSIVANTHFPVRFHYASRPSLGAVLHGRSHQALAWSEIDSLAQLPTERVDVGLPVERLRSFEVVDTPGIGSPLWNAARFERQLPLAHLHVWVTAATRAWRESERQAWSRLSKAQRARGLLVVTHIDLLPDPDDVARVLERLAFETAGLFAAIIPVAVPDAIASSMVGSDAQVQNLWGASGGALLERTIETAFDEIATQRVASAKRVLRRGLSRERERLKYVVRHVPAFPFGLTTSRQALAEVAPELGSGALQLPNTASVLMRPQLSRPPRRAQRHHLQNADEGSRQWSRKPLQVAPDEELKQ